MPYAQSGNHAQSSADCATHNAAVWALSPPLPWPCLCSALPALFPTLIAAATLPGGASSTLTLAPKGGEESLNAEENVSIRGNQRYEIMQRLAARSNEPQSSKSIILRNMVSPEEVRP